MCERFVERLRVVPAELRTAVARLQQTPPAQVATVAVELDVDVVLAAALQQYAHIPAALVELSCHARPPDPLVGKTLTAVATLLQCADVSWTGARALLVTDTLLLQLASLDLLSIDPVRAASVRHILRDGNLTVAAVKKTSEPAAVLLEWVIATNSHLTNALDLALQHRNTVEAIPQAAAAPRAPAAMATATAAAAAAAAEGGFASRKVMASIDVAGASAYFDAQSALVSPAPLLASPHAPPHPPSHASRTPRTLTRRPPVVTAYTATRDARKAALTVLAQSVGTTISLPATDPSPDNSVAAVAVPLAAGLEGLLVLGGASRPSPRRKPNI
jgi:hypothetical protein